MIGFQEKLPLARRRRFCVFQGSRSQSGFTLVEIIVVLSITALLLSAGIGVGLVIYHRMENMEYEAECEQFLDEILSIREMGMKTFSEPSVCKIYQDHAIFSYFDVNGKQHRKRMDFEYFSVLGMNTVFEIVFYSSGTVSRSKTLRLISEKGRKKKLVIQMATGRIYLEDEN